VRFLVDESTGPAVAHWLRDQNHEVFSVYEQQRGMDDDKILAKALAEGRILVTNDKDFGEKIFREQRPHKGIVLLRLGDERASNKIAVLSRLLENHGHRLGGHFVVVTETAVRFARPSSRL
jgi:predicted nuclease of predicted toxin-antitoxin system